MALARFQNGALDAGTDNLEVCNPAIPYRVCSSARSLSTSTKHLEKMLVIYAQFTRYADPIGTFCNSAMVLPHMFHKGVEQIAFLTLLPAQV